MHDGKIEKISESFHAFIKRHAVKGTKKNTKKQKKSAKADFFSAISKKFYWLLKFHEESWNLFEKRQWWNITSLIFPSKQQLSTLGFSWIYQNGINGVPTSIKEEEDLMKTELILFTVGRQAKLKRFSEKIVSFSIFFWEKLAIKTRKQFYSLANSTGIENNLFVLQAVC